MEVIKADNWSSLSPSDWQTVVSYFKKGKVVAYPTDTIYGLGCLASSQSAIERINLIKGRPEDKGMLVLAGSMDMVSEYCDIDSRKEEIGRIWNENRPTSLILPYRDNLAPNLTGKNKGLAVRLPKDAFLRKMIDEIGEPIVSTSVNQSGQDPLFDGEAIIGFFKDKDSAPDLTIDFGEPFNLRPSRLISLLEEGEPKVIRE